MKKIKCFLIASAVLFTSLLATGCASLQTDIVEYTQEELEEIKDIELKLYSLDAGYLEKGGDASKEYTAECSALVKNIEETISDMGVNSAIKARLYAIEGRTYLLMGKTSKAKDLYTKSLRTFKGDTQTVILSRRLGLIKSVDDEEILLSSSEKPLLILEKAIAFYEDTDFTSAAASFDEAFLNLDGEVEECYLPLRNKAWKLKDVSSLTDNKEVKKLLVKDSLTVREILFVTDNITNLLVRCTNGKTYKADDLYRLLLKEGILDSVSSPDGTKGTSLASGDAVTKAALSRYLWNLFNFGKDEASLTKYSAAFRKDGRTSPVKDVDVNDEDFDAILGCVENELINLTDGKNFDCGYVLKGTEAADILKKAENKIK